METLQAWPGEPAEAAIHAAVLRNRSIFDRFPEFDAEDLYQEARMACVKAWPSYNAQKAAWSTFLSVVTRNRLITLCRSRSRRDERERAVAAREWEKGHGPLALAAVAEWVDAGDEAGLPGGAGGDDETLAEWLGSVYRQATRAFPRRRNTERGGRNWFTPPQIVAVVLLMRKRSLSTRGCKLLLEQDEDLRAAIRMTRVPDQSWFHRAKRFATENLKLPAEPRRRTTGYAKAHKPNRQRPPFDAGFSNRSDQARQVEGNLPGDSGGDGQYLGRNRCCSGQPQHGVRPPEER
jgi:DNA-directed RNA polymerase specialized sigma24 family protein